MLKDLVKENRSYRKFDESAPLDEVTLRELIDTARFAPASVNIQPLKYLYCCDRETNDVIFPLTAWAKKLPDFQGPAQGERPTGYIVICTDKEIAPNVQRFDMDVGIVAQTIMLAAVEKGFGGCMIGNYSHQKVSQALHLPENLYPSLILALGKPGEEIRLEEKQPDQNTSYYRDERGLHHVPKRTMEEVALPLPLER